MATVTINTTGRGYNHGSNIVGYERKRFRWVYHTLTIPNEHNGAPVISATITAGEYEERPDRTHSGLVEGTAYTVYFKIVAENDYDSFDPEKITTPDGTITNFGKENDGSYPYLIFYGGVTLTPGSYRVYAFVKQASLGYRYMKHDHIKLTAEYLQYTKCGEPSNISIEQTIQRPDQAINISWSAGADGLGGNTIKAYEIQYKVGTGAWTTATDECSSTSYELSIPSNASRGDSISVRVRTLGEQASYESEYVESSNTCKINQLPKEPKISIISERHVLDGTVVKIPHNASCTIEMEDQGDVDGQVISLIYEDDEGHYNYEESFQISQSKTYRFYASDGLEWSQAIERTFEFNSEPTVTLSSTFEGSGDVAVRSTHEATRGNNGQSSNNIYTFWAHFYDDSGTWKTNVVLQKSSSTTLTIQDIRSYVPDSSLTQYKIEVVRNDGVEDSERVYGLTISSLYKIPAVPEIALNNVVSSYFFNTLQVSYAQTIGYDRVELQVEKDGRAVLARTLSGNTATFSLTSLAAGTNYTFKIRPRSSTFAPSFTTNELTKVLDVSLMSIKTNYDLLNPFTASGQLNITFLNFINMRYTAATETAFESKLSQCGLKDAVIITLKGRYNGKESSESVETRWSTLASQQSTSTLQLDKTTWSGFFEDLGIDKNQSGRHSINLELSFQNEGGETISGNFEQKVAYVDANTIPEVENATLIFPDNQNYLIEGDTIKIQFEYKAYHALSMAHVILQDAETSHQIYVSSYTFEEQVNTITFEETVPEIAKDCSSLELLFVIENSAGQSSPTFSADISAPAYRLVAGQGEITSFEWDDKGISLTFKNHDFGYSNTDLGYTEISLYYLNDNGEEADIFCDREIIEKEYSFTVAADDLPNDLQGKKHANIYIGQICGWSYKHISKYSVTPIISLYKASSTLSYRKNKVGINYTFPENSELIDPSLVVGAHDNSKYVYFYSGRNTASIKLETGEQNGFIIDCGSWDNTSGGTLPVLPSGLAPIAFSGQMIDLYDTEGAVVFYGGDAGI